MAKGNVAILLLAGLFLVSPVLAGEGGLPLKLSRDPFAHPVLVPVVAPVKVKVKVDDVDDWKSKIHLQATMLTSKWAIANVNGKLLRPGESVEGYTLVKVMERKALFRKSGKEILVGMDDEK
ncbi:MAG: hypothetical protein GWP07_03590 [Xanthomonadaceae bacterium]|nr:hypothetical protein [Xanthomonadaceae bacterium]